MPPPLKKDYHLSLDFIINVWINRFHSAIQLRLHFTFNNFTCLLCCVCAWYIWLKTDRNQFIFGWLIAKREMYFFGLIKKQAGRTYFCLRSECLKGIISFCLIWWWGWNYNPACSRSPQSPSNHPPYSHFISSSQKKHWQRHGHHIIMSTWLYFFLWQNMSIFKQT